MRSYEYSEKVVKTTRVSGYKCDICGREHKLTGYDLEYREDSPYITISQAKLDAYMSKIGVDTCDVCSIECMTRYLQQNIDRCLYLCGGDIKIPRRYKLKCDDWK